MIFKTRTIEQYEEENNNIIECDQQDNIQREGVQSIYDEKRILERKGIGIYQKKIKEEEIDEENIAEVKRYNESFDIIDEHREELKEIKKHKDEYNKTKQETERMMNDLKQERERMIKQQREIAKGEQKES